MSRWSKKCNCSSANLVVAMLITRLLLLFVWCITIVVVFTCDACFHASACNYIDDLLDRLRATLKHTKLLFHNEQNALKPHKFEFNALLGFIQIFLRTYWYNCLFIVDAGLEVCNCIHSIVSWYAFMLTFTKINTKTVNHRSNRTNRTVSLIIYLCNEMLLLVINMSCSFILIFIFTLWITYCIKRLKICRLDDEKTK